MVERARVKSRGFKPAVAFVIAVGVAAACLVVWFSVADTPVGVTGASSSATPSVSVSPTAQIPPVEASLVSVCGLPAGDQSVRLRAPEVTWVYEGALGYPVSLTLGPGVMASSPPSCFAHSPDGAVLFASNAAMRVIGATDKQAMLSVLVADGPHKDAQVSEATDRSTPTRLSLFGYRVLSFTPASATVDVVVDATAHSDSARLSLLMSLVWVDGDWFLSGDLASPVVSSEARSLSTYIQWNP